MNNDSIPGHLRADCENCYGLCCVALPYAKSADFAFDKDGGDPCPNLQADYRCGIHHDLREKGFRGCAVYECFGAGQKVSQDAYHANDWRDHPALAEEMFAVFPVMQQLHEMLYYLNEAIHVKAAQPIQADLQIAIEKTESLTNLNPASLLDLDVPGHRAMVNDLLLRTSEFVRAKVKKKNQRMKIGRGIDMIGAKLKGADLQGADLRGAFLIAADLRGSNMRMTDLIGADLRDADLSGANLLGSIFLTQVQVNSAKGDRKTQLPPALKTPEHWQ
ncbi:pentapeptide repeat-containing protein [Bacillus swezeyi]|uniref:Pentapeptide repeat-containing protein n=1 Tax=Bacillus swezeyi TaxID=1925020 RepID=A0A1R1QL83_9BACI|nr:pentapeptide repeat-containing protein [Bacillus swezeyi]MEC1260323.1 pentapeptide repeat-containing protein [Bacillus swezeyi]MED2929930.1 pentapeptide repeat-containing protein [Bacillus swezeyi]MED2964656.1 pentapeptide repeat-containing protein [Bacillus swezeyi]MED3073063.1 pentapeptide repeat-containing protein [Bacillus swezeyi]MED3083100.1 pentapeptide repeat-containing protein [Bacillus swezeyi]